MTKHREKLVGDMPLRRRAKAGSTKVLLAVASGRERVVKTGLLDDGVFLGTLAKAGTLSRTLTVTRGTSVKEVIRLLGRKKAKRKGTEFQYIFPTLSWIFGGLVSGQDDGTQSYWKFNRCDAEGCSNKNLQSRRHILSLRWCVTWKEAARGPFSLIARKKG